MNRRFHPVLGPPIFCDDPRVYASSGNELTETQGRAHRDHQEANDGVPNVLKGNVEWDEFYGPPVRKRATNRLVADEWKRDLDAIRAGRNVELGAAPPNFSVQQGGAPPLLMQQELARPLLAGPPTTIAGQAGPPYQGRPTQQQPGGFASAPQQQYVPPPQPQQQQPPQQIQTATLTDAIAEGREAMERRIGRMEQRHRMRMEAAAKRAVSGSSDEVELEAQNEPPLSASPLEDLALIFEDVLAQSGVTVVQAQRDGIRQMPPDLLKTRIMSVHLQHVDFLSLPPHGQMYLTNLKAEIAAIAALPPPQQQAYINQAPPPKKAAIMETRDIHRALEGGGSPSNICLVAMQQQVLERLLLNGGLAPQAQSHPNQPYPTPEGSRQHSTNVVGTANNEGGKDVNAFPQDEASSVNPMTPESSPERAGHEPSDHTVEINTSHRQPSSEYSHNNTSPTNNDHPNLVPK